MVGRLLCGSVVLGMVMALGGCAVPTISQEDTGQTESHLDGGNDKIAFDFFLGKGLTNVQAAGIIGNLQQESSLDPTISQIGGGPGRGIAQWSAGGRWDTGAGDNVLEYASQHGKNAMSLDLQLDFIWYELSTFPNYGLGQLKAATTLSAAVTAFQDKYEICGQCEQGNRLRFAQDALNAYGNDTPSSSGGAADTAEGTQAFDLQTQQHFFARSGDELHHAFWDASDKQIHHDTWGKGIAGNPATFVINGQQHVFARGTSGSLEHWFWDPTTKQTTHDTWGQGLASDPTVMLINGQQHVWATDGSGTLQHWFWDPTSKQTTNDQWGSGVVGRPTVFLNIAAQHVFVRGTGGAVEHFFWEPGKGITHDTWGQGIAGDPVAHLLGTAQHVWAVDSAGALQHWWWDGKVSHDTWATGGLTGRPSFIASGEQQHVFARGTNGSVEHYWWSKNAGIEHDTWGTGVATDPSAIAMGGGQHVFAQDAAGTIQHWYWTESTGIKHDDWGQ